MAIKKRIYLCSRTAEDAREMNEQVAKALEDAGYAVFVPHRAPHNNKVGSTMQEIYEQDIAELKRADAVVIVGRVGTDCAWEAGFACAKRLPAFWYSPPDSFQPMFWSILSSHAYYNVYALVDAVDKKLGGAEEEMPEPTLLNRLMRFVP